MKSMAQAQEHLAKINKLVEPGLRLSRDVEPEAVYEVVTKDSKRTKKYSHEKIDKIAVWLEGYLARCEEE